MKKIGVNKKWEKLSHEEQEKAAALILNRYCTIDYTQEAQYRWKNAITHFKKHNVPQDVVERSKINDPIFEAQNCIVRFRYRIVSIVNDTLEVAQNDLNGFVY